MKILGIDLGSREVKIVATNNGNIFYKNKISTMKFYRDYCIYNNKIVFNLAKLEIIDIDRFVSTGYGRNNTALNNFKSITEIKAHVYGVFSKTDIRDFIMLDIGGQDVKIVKVENGIITDIELNEKCAASCGRYLENMATVLEISIDELVKHYLNPIEINSTCAIFSESELIGKIAEGCSIDILCAGVNYSLYKRLQPMLSRFSGKNLILSGGVAKSLAIKKYLENDYETMIDINEPEFNGALGCCYYGEGILT